MKKLLIFLPLALLFIACEEKPKTQAVPSENKDTVAAVAVAEESLFEKNAESTDTVSNIISDIDSNSGHYVECEHYIDRKKDVENILLPSSYRIFCGEDPTKAINNDWVSIYEDSTGNYYIKRADYYIADGYAECAEVKTKELKSKDSVILFMNFPNVKKGKIEYVKISQNGILPNDTMRFEFNGISYYFRATGSIVDTTSRDIGNYKLYVSTSAKPEELLLDIKRFRGTFMRLLFIGDIDGDGIPDFIFDTSTDYEEERVTLFLSTMAEKGKITKRVAELALQHDC